jgi:hypothetical protein
VIGRRPPQTRSFHGLGHPLVRVNFRTQSLICDGKLPFALDHHALELFTVSQQGAAAVSKLTADLVELSDTGDQLANQLAPWCYSRGRALCSFLVWSADRNDGG